MLKYGRIEAKMKKIRIDVKNFSLNKTLKSEQCVADLFFFDSIQNHWITYMPVNNVWAKIILKQDNNNTLTIRYFPDEIDEKEVIHKINYVFSLDEDYKNFVEKFGKDKYLMKIYNVSNGIRIMMDINKEYRIIESLLTQNTSVRMIKVMQRNLLVNYGEHIMVGDEIIFSYPDLKRIANDKVDSIREKIKCGYRAKYIKNIAEAIIFGKLDINKISDLDTISARKYLMEFSGIGPKVADLILMYAFSKKDVFPTDIWARRTIGNIYFEGREPLPKELTNFVNEYFGKFASLINLMIFYFERRDKNKLFNLLVWR